MYRLKPYMMPIAMTFGIMFYKLFDSFAFITPYLIFIMLFLTYNNLSFKNLRITSLHLILILIQIFSCLIIYFLLDNFNHVLAQSALICILAPTATAAPVIARMLGGNIASLASYSLLSNFSVAILSPFIFSYIGIHQETSFIQSFLLIFSQISPLLIAPFIATLIIRKLFPSIQKKLQSLTDISFYLWVLALSIVTGKTVSFILNQDSSGYTIEILIASCSLILCIGQFVIGRRIGRYFNDTITGGQGLGQKNTILAIWMAQVYLNPISSLGPGAYILWQNVVNSYQIWHRKQQKNIL